MNIFNERYVANLVVRCGLGRDRRACKTLDAYIATGRLVSRIEQHLGERFRVPVMQPDPPPFENETELSNLLRGGQIAESDPDGSPAISTNDLTGNVERAKVRLEVAKELHDVLSKTVQRLEKDIIEIEKFLPQ